MSVSSKSASDQKHFILETLYQTLRRPEREKEQKRNRYQGAGFDRDEQWLGGGAARLNWGRCLSKRKRRLLKANPDN